MDRLFAPWRLEYVTHVDDARGSCFLCAARDARDDAGHLVLWRGRRSFALLNKFPYAGGHLMVVPRRHTGDFQAIDAAALAEMMRVVQASVGILRRCVKAQGVNIGVNLGRPAGAGLVGHVHVHVVPRWAGDTNFMPLLGEARVISEALDATWRRLRPAFDRISARKTRGK